MSISKRKFKTELNQLLDIIVHSLYSHKEIFLRELISNAGDAIDKMRFETLNDQALLEGDDEWAISISVDKDLQTLTISDNGIGMSKDEMIENLGTIAHSGTKAFLEKAKSSDLQNNPDLIGQFGVGFYAAFMVADQVTVLSRPAKGEGVQWQSSGDGSYTVTEAEKATRGTEVILHLKEEEKDFLEEWRIKELVKKFSNFLEHPVQLEGEVVNSRQAIWLRSKTDVKPEEYHEFYKAAFHGFEEPLEVIHYIAEGTVEFKSLLFIPKTRPLDAFRPESKSKLHLYIQRVFITNECDELLPTYLRFVTGVVDASDLPLNVSREMLQHNPLLSRIKESLTKRVLKTLKEIKDHNFEQYLELYAQFGSILKEGLSSDWTNREKIVELLLFESTATEAGKMTSLDEYIERMSKEQKGLFYLLGTNRELLEYSPHLEGVKARKEEVLFMMDPIDEFVVPMLEYKEKKFLAVNKDEGERSEEEKEEQLEKEKTFTTFLEFMGTCVPEVKEVRLSTRLKESASCLILDKEAVTPQMELMMKQMGQEIPESKRILEINPDHPAVQALQKRYEKKIDEKILGEHAQLLYDQALVAEGVSIKDPGAFARRINSLLSSIPSS